MKKLMITAATSALMVGMAACSQSSDDIEMGEANYGETQTAQTTQGDMANDNEMVEDAEALGDVADHPGATDGAENMGEVYLADNELSAEELMGAKVIGASGEDIATVDDLLINADDEIESVIFKSGDFLDITGKKVAIPYNEVDVTMAVDQEPRFSVGMTEEAVQNVAEFEQDGLNDYSLASEMIGTTADYTASEKNARIRDIIVDDSGSVKYAVISDPVMMDDLRRLEFDRIRVEQGDGGLVIEASADEIETLPVFVYEVEADDSDMPMSQDTMMDDDSMGMSDETMDRQ